MGPQKMAYRHPEILRMEDEFLRKQKEFDLQLAGLLLCIITYMVVFNFIGVPYLLVSILATKGAWVIFITKDARALYRCMYFGLWCVAMYLCAYEWTVGQIIAFYSGLLIDLVGFLSFVVRLLAFAIFNADLKDYLSCESRILSHAYANCLLVRNSIPYMCQFVRNEWEKGRKDWKQGRMPGN